MPSLVLEVLESIALPRSSSKNKKTWTACPPLNVLKLTFGPYGVTSARRQSGRVKGRRAVSRYDRQ